MKNEYQTKGKPSKEAMHPVYVVPQPKAKKSVKNGKKNGNGKRKARYA